MDASYPLFLTSWCKDIYISFEIEYKCRSKKNTCVEGNGTWYEGTD